MPLPRLCRLDRLRTWNPLARRPPAFALVLVLAVALSFVSVGDAARAAEDEDAPVRATEEHTPLPDRPAIRPAPQRSPVELFAGVERAWIAGDAGTLASYCDSAVTRVSLKPSGSPASAPTLGGLAFLIDDPLHLVSTRAFRIVRVTVDSRKLEARAWARWNGDWGAGKGVRDLEVALTARGRPDGRWLLTEIRAND